MKSVAIWPKGQRESGQQGSLIPEFSCLAGETEFPSLTIWALSCTLEGSSQEEEKASGVAQTTGHGRSGCGGSVSRENPGSDASLHTTAPSEPAATTPLLGSKEGVNSLLQH